MSEDFFVSETPGICGGYPRLGHTRIAIRSLVEVYLDTKDVRQTAEMFPQLPRHQIECAIAWYRAHPTRVNEDIERNAHAWAELTGQR